MTITFDFKTLDAISSSSFFSFVFCCSTRAWMAFSMLSNLFHAVKPFMNPSHRCSQHFLKVIVIPINKSLNGEKMKRRKIFIMLNVKQFVRLNQLATFNLITCNLWTMLPLSSVASALMMIGSLGCFVLDSA